MKNPNLLHNKPLEWTLKIAPLSSQLSIGELTNLDEVDIIATWQ